jgi:hypothetical protein
MTGVATIATDTAGSRAAHGVAARARRMAHGLVILGAAVVLAAASPDLAYGEVGDPSSARCLFTTTLASGT